jgi:HK97 family phage major capsid protein
MSDKNEMNEVLTGLASIREIAEKSASIGAEAKEQIAKLGDETSAKLAAAQAKGLEIEAANKKMQSEIEAVKGDYEELYKKANRLGVTASGVNEFVEANDKYKGEFSRYLRKGIAPSSAALDEIATAFVKNTIDVKEDEMSLKNAAYNMVNEQGTEDGKGFYIFNDAKSMVTGNNPDGGYLVRPDQRTDVSVTRIFESSPMRAVSNIITTGTNEVEIPIDDNEGVSGGWVGEVQSRADTGTPQVGILKIAVHEQFAQPLVTQKMLDDAFVNIEAWLARKTDDKLTRDENTAFVSGDGANKPKGFLSYAAWAAAGTYERNKLEQIASGTSGAITADGLRKLQGALLEAYQPSAVFMMKRDSFTDVSLLKDGAGRYLLNERTLADGVDIRLLGKPLFFADDMQAVAGDALAVAYGDFGSGYTIVDRMGLRVLRDPYTAKPFIKFYTTKRVGGAVTNYQAIKIQKLAVSV